MASSDQTKTALVAAASACSAVLLYKLLSSVVGGKVASADQSNRSTTSSSGGGPTAYETQRAVDEYIQFHFGDASDLMPYEFGPKDALKFTSVLATLGKPHVASGKKIRALDIGCAVGGATFELAKWCNEVIGIDFSHAFVRAAEKMRVDAETSFGMVQEGEILEVRLARRPDVDVSRVSFQQGDACNLPTSLGQFDYVLAANLICRLPEPLRFLERLHTLVAPGGVAVLVSPHSWLPGWTNKSKWLGGYCDPTGKPIWTEDTIESVLTPHFERVEVRDVSFLIREHARKFQYGVSCGVVWKRRA
eukprot:m.229525 g.229525  ORF g.229525 m.229525 type:complete len:305 (+) comp17766_c0_seq1:35-949(+)